MLLNPSIMALLLVSASVSLMLLAAAAFGIAVLRGWDINSGSAYQLRLERRTYLISTLLTWAFAAQLLSLLLFVYNAEALSGQFVGAMCATGVLNANPWGWPTLWLKILVFFGAAVWLALNRLDNQGHDYPLIRVKYALLLGLLPLALAEPVVQWQHFAGLKPDVITSCCGALFTADGDGVAAEVAALSPMLALGGLGVTAVAVLASGIVFARTGRGGGLFALAALAAFLFALIAIVSLIALYVYEHPHHHCPFCLLKGGHGGVGYALYVPLFLALAGALSAAVIGRWHDLPSIATAVAHSRRHYAWTAVTLFTLFYAISAWLVLGSNLTMQGVWW
jgi:hypothetical protein